MTDPLSFRFRDLHPNAPELREDLGWLLRFVASEFAICVHGESIFDEIEFPVLELAHVLHTWVARDMVAGRGLNYEVTGGENGTLSLWRHSDGWCMDSVHRAPDATAPAPLTDEEPRVAIASVIEELDCEVRRDYDGEIRALLERVGSDGSR